MARLDMRGREKHVSKAELMEARWLGASFILSLFSVFFGVVSAYIAGLYFVLSKATLALRMLAFFVLTMGFLFLGGMAISVTDLIEVMAVGWDSVDIPLAKGQVVRAFITQIGGSMQIYFVGALLGWAVAFIVYIALAYLTFFYRWPDRRVAG
jgi:hypothetical protein